MPERPAIGTAGAGTGRGAAWFRWRTAALAGTALLLVAVCAHVVIQRAADRGVAFEPPLGWLPPAGDRPFAGSGERDDSAGGIHRRLPDVRFTDLSGEAGALSDYQGHVLVVSMTSLDCPISRKLLPALQRLPAEFEGERVRFLLVNAHTDATLDQLAEHEAQLPGWRLVADESGLLARVLQARTTTESFVIDEARTLRYRGAVSDRFAVGVNRPVAGTDWLGQAIATVLARQAVAVPVTHAPGCVLDLEKVEPSTVQVTWHDQISRLIQAQCVECHRPGEAAPFALETYSQVVAKRAMIQRVMDRGTMPPWFAEPPHERWRNARAVSSADRELFSRWVLEGCAEGDPADAPVGLSHATGWTIREPDIVIAAEPQEIPAEGFIEWRKFLLEFEAADDLWVCEAEIRPSAPEVVHHAMLYVEYPEGDPRRQAQTRAESEASGGANGFWLSYFPGRKAMILPPGRAKLIPRGGRIHLQMHYNANGTPTTDRPRVGLKLRAQPPEKTVVSSSSIKWDLQIPPNSLVRFQHSDVFAEDVRLLSLMPHMHARGAAAQVLMVYPDGRAELLLDVPQYDFDWQVSYEFLEPLLVTRGSRMVIRHSFDNTASNPANPDPTKRVRHGNATSDEMMITFFDWEPAGDEPPVERRSKRRPFR
jgi:thiol-disulfide isomerase/thioredoxin